MSTLVGMCLNGRYRLDAQIGAGGMSTVYRAFDTTLERRVAVKLMHREIASDSDQLERFRREARSVAQLSHPHIVGWIDAGEEDGRPYIVFEYVEGETLKDRIRRMGRLPVDEAIAYSIEIARALGAAHARGIVHRDIKPQNVLVDAEGSAKVTDFGIARSLDRRRTADGRVLGTTDYVSPEQVLGHDVDGQSDIYSLGVVLYEMLTGEVPFHGENQVSVAIKHVREDMPDVQSVAARGLRAARGRARPNDGEGPPAPPPGRGDGHPTSRRRSPRRRRGRAPRPARRPPCEDAAPRPAPPAAAAAPRRVPVLLLVPHGRGRGRGALSPPRQGRRAGAARHRAGRRWGAARRADHLGEAHLGQRLRPARRRQTEHHEVAPARRRPGPRHRVDDREPTRTTC